MPQDRKPRRELENAGFEGFWGYVAKGITYFQRLGGLVV
jgi:hypothetical protein